MSGSIEIEVKDNIGTVVIKSEGKKNALSMQMWKDLSAGVDRLGEDRSVRAILLRGWGDGCFSAGADISEFKNLRTGKDASAEYADANRAAFLSLKHSPKVVVAMIRGICFGGGFAIASFCDIRIGDTASRFCIPAARLGLGYGRENTRQLVEVVGAPRAREILFTARVYDSQSAFDMGILHDRIEEDDIERYTAEYLQALAANAPLTQRAAKIAINDIMAEIEDQDHAAVDVATKLCYESEDYKEGQAAFAEKRRPVFKGQ